MNKQDYLMEVDTLHASPALRARVAATADTGKSRRPPRAVTTRWLSLAAALILVVGLGAAAPTIIRSLSDPGGDVVAPPPVVTEAPAIPDEELTDLLAADIPYAVGGEQCELLFSSRQEGRTLGVLRWWGESHAQGFGNLLFGVFNDADKEEVGLQKAAWGDHGALTTWTEADGHIRLLWTNDVEYQGRQDCGAGLYDFYQGELTEVTEVPLLSQVSSLPPGAATMLDPERKAAFWSNRKGVINGNGLDIYTRIEEKGSYADDAWAFEFHVNLDSSAPAPTPILDTLSPSGGGTPILPLTALDGTDGLVLSRAIAYDITKAEETVLSWNTPLATVTDRYILNNTTNADKDLTLFYPYVCSFGVNGSATFPTLQVNGETRPFSALHSGALLSLPKSSVSAWADYAAAIDRDYCTNALSPAPRDLWDTPAYVYTVEDIAGYEAHGTGVLAIDLVLEDPEHTQVYTYGFNSLSGVGTADLRCYFTPGGDAKELHTIILVGGDLASSTVTGYQDATLTPGQELSELTARLTGAPTEMYLGTAVGNCIEDYLSMTNSRYPTLYNLGAWGDTRSFYDAVAALMASGDERYADPRLAGRLDVLLDDAFFGTRVMYCEIPVTIPAGGSVSLEFSFQHYGGYAQGDAEPTLWGSFSFSPTLGTAVPPDSLTAVVITDGTHSITETNLLERRAHPVTKTTAFDALDPKTERYFFELN